MEHAELILEMPRIEQMPTQDRLLLARRRRNMQLKVYSHNEKEFNRKPPKQQKSAKRGIFFNDSVVLLEAAARNDIDEVRRLLMKGVSPDSCNEDGLTALHQCCIDDNEAMLSLLLEYGANVNAEDSEKWTPLHAAATCGHLKLVRILISRGANLLAVNADGNMPYDICEDEAALDYIEGEMSKRGVTQIIIDDTRASTERQMLYDLKQLVANNGDLERYDSQGATPLHIAAANGYISVVSFLLDHNVRTDVKDKDDWQPSHAAACWGHLDVLELLAQAGADLNARNKHDETPSDICEDSEIKERILELRTEQESKIQADTIKKVRRSQSNTRTQSVRRTSLREKSYTARRDVVAEARMRIQAEHKGFDNADAAPVQNNSNNNNVTSTYSTNNNNNSEPLEPTNTVNNDQPKSESNALQVYERRKEPEGKDNDLVLEHQIMDNTSIKENTYTTDVNGKVTVHVVVTINGNGTLADLKKQRTQIRNSVPDVNSITSPGSITDSDLNISPTTDIVRFVGETTDEGMSYSKSKRCCVIQ